jgi:hypothetical protein
MKDAEDCAHGHGCTRLAPSSRAMRPPTARAAAPAVRAAHARAAASIRAGPGFDPETTVVGDLQKTPLPVRIWPLSCGFTGSRTGDQPGAARSGAVDGWARPGAGCARAAAAGSGMTLLPSASGERCRVPATAATAAGRDALLRGLRGANRRRSGQASAAGGRGLTLLPSSPPGWRSAAGTQVSGPPRRACRWSLAGAAGPWALARPRSCPVRGGQVVTMAGRSGPARRRAGPGPAGLRPRCPGRREHSSCHRCRIRSRQARDLARRLASGTDGLSRMRGSARATSTGHHKSQADGHALLR